MLRNIIGVFAFFTMSFLGIGQDVQMCGADEMRVEMLMQNNSLAGHIQEREVWLENFTKKFIEVKTEGLKGADDPYIIPVVFHVIHDYGFENISDEQIFDAIDVLNQRFRKQSADTNQIVEVFKPLHADCEIEFRLAQKDPDGNCTKGINRIASSLTSIGDHAVKSLIQWPTNKYLNVYVVKNAAGLAGHAVWPADADTIPGWDGIVISHSYVGSIGTSNATRSVVLAHECGHYLNLHHIWGGNNVPGFYYYPCADPDKDCNIDDLVDDTPPTIGWQTCNLEGVSCGNVVDNVQNMMDYSYCNKMFTYGQKDRMHACLNSPIAGRNNLWQESNLIETGVFDTTSVLCKAEFISDKTVVCKNGDNEIEFVNTSFNGDVSVVSWSFPGGIPSSSTELNPQVVYEVEGVYPVTLTVYHGMDSVSITKPEYIYVMPDSGSVYPLIESFENTTSLYGPEWFVSSEDTVNAFELNTLASYSGSKSIMINGYDHNHNTIDELYSPITNIEGAEDLTFTFKYAFARKTEDSDDLLRVFISKNCGLYWVQRLSLIGDDLETVAPTNSFFVPSSLSDWQEASIDVPTSFYSENFRLKFLFHSKGGNNLYIDDINIKVEEPTGLNSKEESNIRFNIYPNPVHHQLMVETEGEGQHISFRILNTLGEVVCKSEDVSSQQQLISIDVSMLNKGIYFIELLEKRMLKQSLSFIKD